MAGRASSTPSTKSRSGPLRAASPRYKYSGTVRAPIDFSCTQEACFACERVSLQSAPENADWKKKVQKCSRSCSSETVQTFTGGSFTPESLRGLPLADVERQKASTYVYDERLGRKRRHDPWFASHQLPSKRDTELKKRKTQFDQKDLSQDMSSFFPRLPSSGEFIKFSFGSNAADMTTADSGSPSHDTPMSPPGSLSTSPTSFRPIVLPSDLSTPTASCINSLLPYLSLNYCTNNNNYEISQLHSTAAMTQPPKPYYAAKMPYLPFERPSVQAVQQPSYSLSAPVPIPSSGFDQALTFNAPSFDQAAEVDAPIIMDSLLEPLPSDSELQASLMALNDWTDGVLTE